MKLSIARVAPSLEPLLPLPMLAVIQRQQRTLEASRNGRFHCRKKTCSLFYHWWSWPSRRKADASCNGTSQRCLYFFPLPWHGCQQGGVWGGLGWSKPLARGTDRQGLTIALENGKLDAEAKLMQGLYLIAGIVSHSSVYLANHCTTPSLPSQSASPKWCPKQFSIALSLTQCFIISLRKKDSRAISTCKLLLLSSCPGSIRECPPNPWLSIWAWFEPWICGLQICFNLWFQIQSSHLNSIHGLTIWT